MDDILDEIYNKIKWQRRWVIVIFIGLVLFLITATYFVKGNENISMILTFIKLIYVIICGRLQHLMKFINPKLVHPGLLGVMLFFSFFYCWGFGTLLITINLLDKSMHIIKQYEKVCVSIKQDA